MPVNIRLARRGSKKRPFYDIVAIDSRKKRDGKPLEKLGYINPLLDKDTENRKKIVIYPELVEKWLKNGAIPTEIVAKKLRSLGFANMENFVEPQKTILVGTSKKEKNKMDQEKADIEKARVKAKKDAEKAAEKAAELAKKEAEKAAAAN